MQHLATDSRNDSLDAFRGVAILLMVLSGSIAFAGALPGCMYHAQVPPPAHTFNPAIPGITWVDLVFPFFLFSMGAAIPLALHKWQHLPHATRKIWWIAIRRYLLLTWFAIFILHMRPSVIANPPGNTAYCLSLLAFVLLFFQLYQPVHDSRRGLLAGLKIAAYIVAAGLLYMLPFHKGAGFSPSKSDIIILVLANMAFFGTIIWWYTRNHLWVRVALLPCLMAVLLTGKDNGSVNHLLYSWTPLPWMYQFYYLKYLFIIIPGTIAGEWMLQKRNDALTNQHQRIIGMIGLLLIICNVFALYTRQLLLNFCITGVLLSMGLYWLRNHKASISYHFFRMGSYLLLLGLLFESYEGGIKKDPSTFSYYFVTTGLSVFMLLFFYGLQTIPAGAVVNRFLASNGKNPMVAYVAGSLLLTPLLKLSGVQSWLDTLHGNALAGFLKGVLFTTAIAWLTYFFTRKKWFWKT